MEAKWAAIILAGEGIDVDALPWSLKQRQSLLENGVNVDQFRNNDAWEEANRWSALDRVTRGAPIAIGATSTIKLFRAVGPAELADIRATGQFRVAGHAEGKYFAFTAEGAAIEGTAKGTSFTIAQAEIPANTSIQVYLFTDPLGPPGSRVVHSLFIDEAELATLHANMIEGITEVAPIPRDLDNPRLKYIGG